MSMTNEQIQALKADLEKAGGLEWLNMCADLEYCKNNPGHWLMSIYKTNVLAKMVLMSIDLLAERDADKALIAESVVLFETLRQRIAELEKYAKNRDEENQGLMLTVGRLRIEREQARTLTVKLPQRQEPTSSGHYGDGYLVPNNSGSALDYEETIDALQEACAAAGITLVVGE